MHVQDLDKTLQMERTASKEAQKTFEEMNKKLRYVKKYAVASVIFIIII